MLKKKKLKPLEKMKNTITNTNNIKLTTIQDNILKINKFIQNNKNIDYEFPCIIIPYHNRVKIIDINLNILLSNPKNKIILAYSSDEDDIFLQKYNNDSLLKVRCNNNPLGYKFQYLIDVAKYINFENILICGSDDFMEPQYVEKIYNIYKDNPGRLIYGVNYIDCIYKSNIYTYKLSNHVKISGSGRLLSNKFLNKFDWKIYNTKLNYHIDNSCTSKLVDNEIYIADNMTILSYKDHEYNMIHNFEIFKQMNGNLSIIDKNINKDKYNFMEQINILLYNIC